MHVNRDYTAKNLFVRGGNAVPEFIVLHDTAGNGGLGDVKYLAQDPENRGVSVDFVIPKDGTIYQLNPDLNRKYTSHAGRKTAFRGHSNRNVNRYSVGIEIGQRATLVEYPEVQIRSVAKTCAYLCDTFSLTKTDITTHAKIITDGSRSDPRKFPWDIFWVYFNEMSGLVLPGEVSGDARIYHLVRKGDTLYALSQHYLTSVEQIKALNGMDDRSNTIHPGQKLVVKE